MRKMKAINNTNYVNEEKKFLMDKLEELESDLCFLIYHWRKNIDNVDEKFFEELEEKIEELKELIEKNKISQ